MVYAHVNGATDSPCFGDPGLFTGAGEDGVLADPRDGDGNSVPLYRHKAAYMLFDQQLKFHMFLVDIDSGLQLDQDFRTDLEEIILIAKPAYTYPYVTPGTLFKDAVILSDVFNITGIGFELGGEADGRPDSLIINNNGLLVGDPTAPVYFGDFFRYGRLNDAAVPGAPVVPIVAGTVVDLSTILPAGCRFLALSIHGTVAGQPLLEGRDYTFDWRIVQDDFTPNLTAWQLTALTDWDDAAFPLISFQYVKIVNGVYDTLLGDTPIINGGDNPTYVRHTALKPGVNYAQELASLRSEHLDRPLQLVVNDNGLSYTY